MSNDACSIVILDCNDVAGIGIGYRVLLKEILSELPIFQVRVAFAPSQIHRLHVILPDARHLLHEFEPRDVVTFDSSDLRTAHLHTIARADVFELSNVKCIRLLFPVPTTHDRRDE